MGNLYGKFRVDYLNFHGDVNIQKGIINFSDLISLEYEVIKKIDKVKLKEVFDDFYGGQIFEKDEKLVLTNIPVRVLYFETEGISKVVGIGHLQNDSWICKFKDGIVTEEIIVKEQVDLYLKGVMDEFPRSLDKFVHIFRHNPYEICEMMKLKDVSLFELQEIFEKAFEIISSKN